jgi:hypothetical protein
LKVDLRYAEVQHDLWALGHLLAILESTIERLAGEYRSERLAELDGLDPDEDPAEFDMASQDSYDMEMYVLPRFNRGSFAVLLTAALEAGISSVAETRGKEIGASGFVPGGRGFLRAARKHFASELGLTLDTDASRYGRLIDLYRVRNAIAHSNGVRERLPEARWNELLGILAKNGGDARSRQRDALVLTHMYLVAAYNDVSGCLTDLVERAKGAS